MPKFKEAAIYPTCCTKNEYQNWRNGAGSLGISGFCTDCLPEFANKKRAEGTCNNKNIIFRLEHDGFICGRIPSDVDKHTIVIANTLDENGKEIQYNKKYRRCHKTRIEVIESLKKQQVIGKVTVDHYINDELNQGEFISKSFIIDFDRLNKLEE